MSDQTPKTSTGAFPIAGYLCMDGWAGQTRTVVAVIGETAKSYRIEAVKRMKFAGRHNWLDVGQSRLVPKYAVTLAPEIADPFDTEDRP